jgi:hypothetical protein
MCSIIWLVEPEHQARGGALLLRIFYPSKQQVPNNSSLEFVIKMKLQAIWFYTEFSIFLRRKPQI